jgi:hypothetical protein
MVASRLGPGPTEKVAAHGESGLLEDADGRPDVDEFEGQVRHWAAAFEESGFRDFGDDSNRAGAEGAFSLISIITVSSVSQHLPGISLSIDVPFRHPPQLGWVHALPAILGQPGLADPIAGIVRR